MMGLTRCYKTAVFLHFINEYECMNGLKFDHTEDIVRKVCYLCFANLGKMRPNPLPDNME